MLNKLQNINISALIVDVTTWLQTPFAKFVAVAGVFAAAVSGFPKLLAAIQAWANARRAARLSMQLTQSTHTPSFSADDINEATSNYVAPNCSSIDPSNESDLRNVVVTEPAFDVIESILNIGGDSRHAIILADSGMGKTTFCLNFYAKEMRKKPKKRRSVAIIALGRGDAIDKIKKIERKQDTILFLDAFDEDHLAIQNPDSRLSELMSSAEDFKHVIVTCRSQFFRDDESIPKGSGIMFAGPRKAGARREYPLRKLFLAPLNAKQISKYVRLHFPYSKISVIGKRKAARDLIDAIPELSVRPMLLALVPDLVKEKRKISELFELYEFMIEKWLLREKGWIEEAQLLSISKSIAVDIYLRQQEGLGDRISIDLLKSISDREGCSVETWKLTSRSLLNRDLVGLYKFAHRSILEYLFISSAIDGDKRCFGVPWTDFMKDLFLSWGRSSTSEKSRSRAHEILSSDLRATQLLPLADELRSPRAISVGELRASLSTTKIAPRSRKAVPIAWRKRTISVSRKRNLIEVADVAHDLTWVTTWLDEDLLSERDIYRDSYSEIYRELSEPYDGRTPALNSASRGRLPSLDEVCSICDIEHLMDGKIFMRDNLYWLGDNLNRGTLLAFTVGANPLDYPRCAKLGERPLADARSTLYIYEVSAKSVSKAAYTASYLGDQYVERDVSALSCRVLEGQAEAQRMEHLSPLSSGAPVEAMTEMLARSRSKL